MQGRHDTWGVLWIIDLHVTVIFTICIAFYFAYHYDIAMYFANSKLNYIFSSFEGPLQIESCNLHEEKVGICNKDSGNDKHPLFFEDGIMTGVIGFQMLYVFVAVLVMLRKWKRRRRSRRQPASFNIGII